MLGTYTYLAAQGRASSRGSLRINHLTDSRTRTKQVSNQIQGPKANLHLSSSTINYKLSKTQRCELENISVSKPQGKIAATDKEIATIFLLLHADYTYRPKDHPST